MEMLWWLIAVVLFVYIMTATFAQLHFARKRRDDDFFGGPPTG